MPTCCVLKVHCFKHAAYRRRDPDHTSNKTNSNIKDASNVKIPGDNLCPTLNLTVVDATVVVVAATVANVVLTGIVHGGSATHNNNITT